MAEAAKPQRRRHYEGLSDADLLELAKVNEPGAFDELVGRFRDRVYRLAHGMTKSSVDAEEVVQETFLSVFRSLPRYRAEASPSTWIYRIASNFSLMRLRTKRRKPLTSFDDVKLESLAESIDTPGSWAKPPDGRALDAELGARLSDAIQDLPVKYRSVLLLRDIEGLSNEEAAETLGLTIPTVKSRLHRSREHVRARLSQYVAP